MGLGSGIPNLDFFKKKFLKKFNFEITRLFMVEFCLNNLVIVQTIPRTVLFDDKTGTNILQWPVQEIESLRRTSTNFEDVLIEPGSVVPLDIGTATQV